MHLLFSHLSSVALHFQTVISQLLNVLLTLCTDIHSPQGTNPTDCGDPQLFICSATLCLTCSSALIYLNLWTVDCAIRCCRSVYVNFVETCLSRVIIKSQFQFVQFKIKAIPIRLRFILSLLANIKKLTGQNKMITMLNTDENSVHCKEMATSAYYKR